MVSIHIYVSGKGPFPGVIDMFGGLIPIMETRAALLASHGYAALALSYVHMPGLPQKLTDIELTYFEVNFTITRKLFYPLTQG